MSRRQEAPQSYEPSHRYPGRYRGRHEAPKKWQPRVAAGVFAGLLATAIVSGFLTNKEHQRHPDHGAEYKAAAAPYAAAGVADAITLNRPGRSVDASGKPVRVEQVVVPLDLEITSGTVQFEQAMRQGTDRSPASIAIHTVGPNGTPDSTFVKSDFRYIEYKDSEGHLQQDPGIWLAVDASAKPGTVMTFGLHGTEGTWSTPVQGAIVRGADGQWMPVPPAQQGFGSAAEQVVQAGTRHN
jgi:hypothetical protein